MFIDGHALVSTGLVHTILTFHRYQLCSFREAEEATNYLYHALRKPLDPDVLLKVCGVYIVHCALCIVIVMVMVIVIVFLIVTKKKLIPLFFRLLLKS